MILIQALLIFIGFLAMLFGDMSQYIYGGLLMLMAFTIDRTWS